ncbi:MAG: DUF4920 domain-containing protein [Gracilimonas sp.]|uniref:DUF4920 domain-containing protein n=1 Tax=Gracilimonas TaxID=649462 RepID=UPI001B1DB33E|nr:DUF4920 domain-containing protein [Gracilimonas sp.]MBO6586343.1 DUF4920 domain-containing protein [Gracilimonas sp.]MBO6615000.1 DUF4920 domain-containing protein [Gracilimonas sp.]
MKKIFVPVILMLLSTPLLAQEAEVIRLSEPVQETETYEVFGSEVEQWKEVTSLVSLIESEKELSGEQVTIETEVAKVCQKKGCFFVANQDGYSARITFKDYGFFIPTDSQGKTVTLVGTFTVKELSEDQAKHYAEDAGEDAEAIKGPQKEYSIVATSVMIPKS